MRDKKQSPKSMSRKGMSRPQKWFLHWGSKSWTFFEIILVSVALGTPYWMGANRPRISLDLAKTFSVSAPKESNSITSRIIALPLPAERKGVSPLMPLTFVVETKQFRFEKQQNRNPAAVANEWGLKKITRQHGNGDWQEVTLIKNDSKEFVGSSFLELFEGENKFVVTFQSSAGVDVSYPVKIDFKRANDS